MSNVPPIQNLPPLSSITDPAVRNYLQVLTNGWRVRNGEIGEGDEKFLTVSDLKAGVSEAATAASNSATGVTAVGQTGGIASKIANEYKKLSDAIMQSRLWKELESRLAVMERPEWFDKQFGAAVKTQNVIIETATQAVAKQVTTAVAKINDNVSMVRDEISSVSNVAGATAKKVTTLQTSVNDAVSVAEEAFTLAQNVDGELSGAWSVKIDASKPGKEYVTGFGLGISSDSGGATSEFYVKADRFAIGDPTKDTPVADLVPFAVSGGKVYINAAAIKEASIDSLHIAGNAVVVPYFWDNYPNLVHDIGSLKAVHTASFTLKADATVMIIATCRAFNAGPGTNVRIAVVSGGTASGGVTSGGWRIMDISASIEEGLTKTYVATGRATLSAGSHVMHLELGNDWTGGGPWHSYNASIMIMGVQR